MNVKSILTRTKKHPIIDLVNSLINKRGDHPFFRSDLFLFIEQYHFFILSAERSLKNISYLTRSSNRTSKQVREIRRFFDVDFCNFLIHSRILIDRSLFITKHFWSGTLLPSFLSFNKHKKFFSKSVDSIPADQKEYAAYIKDKTDWFNDSLKWSRDNVVVHAKQDWIKSYGTFHNETEIKLTVIVPDKMIKLGKVEYKAISIPTVIDQINNYFSFLERYWRKHIT